MALCLSALLPPLMFGLPHGSELLLIFIVVLLVVGPSQLPKIGRALGGSIKEFKDGIKSGFPDDEDDPDEKKSESRTTVETGPAHALPTDPEAQPQTPESAPQRDSSSH